MPCSRAFEETEIGTARPDLFPDGPFYYCNWPNSRGEACAGKHRENASASPWKFGCGRGRIFGLRVLVLVFPISNRIAKQSGNLNLPGRQTCGNAAESYFPT